jgi:hypothetical protein
MCSLEDVAPNGYAIARVTVRQKKTGRPVPTLLVFDPEGDDIASPQFAVDDQIEKSRVESSPFDVELGPDRPHVFWAKRWLGPD